MCRSAMLRAASCCGSSGFPRCPRPRESLQADLVQREFLPLLIRILSISANSEPCEWEVETDRGRTKFVLKTDEDVRRIEVGRAMVTDANGMEYLIADLAALDATSRKYLERYL